MKRTIALGAALLALAVYLVTLSPGVVEGDPGEFQFVPYILGIPHPPGYPLYCLLGWVWSHLFPLGDVAFRMNLFSAIWGAAAVGVLALLGLEAIGTKWWPAVVGALAFAFSRTFWSQSTVAEVYTLNAFLVAAFLWAVLKGLDLTVLALIAGLGLAHHRSFLFFIPGAVAFYIVKGKRPRGSLLAALALFLAPLLLYLIIPLRAPSLPYLKVQLSPDDTLILYGNSLKDFVDFILAKRFGGLVNWEAVGVERAVEALRWLGEEFGWGGVALGIIGLTGLILRRRGEILALTGLGFASQVAFNLAYFIGDIRFLYVPAYLVFAFWIACGAREFADRLGGKAFILLLLPIALLIQNFQALTQASRAPVAERWTRILSLPLPEGAILLSNDRDELTPLYYYQLVEKKRPDLMPLYPLIVPELSDIGLVLDRALSSGRPVFTIKPMEGLEVAYEVQEWNGLWRVEGKVSGEGLTPLNLKVSDSLILAGYKLREKGKGVEVVLYWKVLSPLGEDLHSYVHLLGAAGERVAGSDHRPGGVFYPSSLWKPGQVLEDVHWLEGELAFPLRLRAGLYRWPSLEPFGQAVEFEARP